MKNHLLLASCITVLVLFYSAKPSLAQGNLAPPGPPAPTMKTLSQIEPRIPISVVPTNLTASGSYYFTTNLTGLAGNFGILVYTNDVIIDLNGFTLTGVSNANTAIAMSGTYSNLVVKNGAIKNWGGNGIDCSPGSQDSFINVKVMSCDNGILSGGYDSIQSCSFNANRAYGCQLSSNNLVKDSNISNNGSLGIVTSYADQIVNCLVANNAGSGIYLNEPGCSVTGCNVSRNFYSGIYVFWGEAMICNNEVYSNNVSTNTSHAGIYIFDSNCRVEGNHLVQNGYAGLVIAPNYTGNIIVRNTAVASTTNYLLQPNNDVGPIGTATNSTSPWANISN